MRGRAFATVVAPIAVVLLSAASAVSAETYSFRLDPAATRVAFLLDAFMHKVHGTAALARGEIRFDGESGAAQGEVVVDATTAQTGNEKRDRDMHVKVLESEAYPEIVLTVDGYEGRFDPAAASEVVVKARLRIHGAEHPIQLEMALAPEPEGASGAKRLEATTTFSVPYVEWGMKDPSKALLRVGKVVEVTIETSGTLASGD
jgi:polyisoprenoid-binding protein YceI